MSPTRRITMLGLSLLASVGLMAVTAGAAHAAGEFRLLGKTFTAQSITQKNFLGEVPLAELLVGTPGGLFFAIHCEGGFMSGDALVGGNFTYHIEFVECEILKNPNCIIYPEEEEQGSPGFILFAGSGTLVLHGTAPNNIFGASKSEEFGRIYFGGPKCTLPEESSIDGGIVFAFPTASTELVEQEVCFTQGKEGLFGVSQLRLLGEPVVIDPSGCGFIHLEALDTWGME